MSQTDFENLNADGGEEIVNASLTGGPDTVAVIDADSASPQGTPCPACGSPVEDDDRFCPACGSPNEIATQRADTIVEAEAAADTGHLPGKKHLRCETCGAEVAVNADQRSHTCAFCDSKLVLEFAPQQTGRQRPEFIIGFAVTPEQALERFHTWIKSNSWFHPGDLALARIADRLQGVYLPFWSFSMLAQSAWGADIGEHWYETQTYTEKDSQGKTVTKTRRVQHTEWWNLNGRHHRYYSGYLVSGSRGLSQQDADRIQPFQLPALRRYEPYFLAGWLSEEYSVERDAALQLCQQEFHRREQRNIAAFLPGDTHRRLSVTTNFSDVNSDLCLLPLYILSYRYRDKVFRFLVNGQTGKVAGDKPVSWVRILLGIGIGVLAIGLLVMLILILVKLLG